MRLPPNVFPWGNEFPPPEGTGNIGGIENTFVKPWGGWRCAHDWKDAHPRTSAVGLYIESKFGLFDIVGNMKELCIAEVEKPTVFFFRGASWMDGAKEAKIENRSPDRSGKRYPNKGFRVVLDLSREADRSVPEFKGKPGNLKGENREDDSTKKEAPAKLPVIARLNGEVVKFYNTSRGGRNLPTTDDPEKAAKERPYENSLGMRFVPVPPVGGKRILLSIWETRVKDFRAFVNYTGYRQDQTVEGSEIRMMVSSGWEKKTDARWDRLSFVQKDDQPVGTINPGDATAFCSWLTSKESKKYRLPTDAEWINAVRLGQSRNEPTLYSWGNSFPPAAGTGNIAGSEVISVQPWGGWTYSKDWKDDHPRSSPVGLYRESKHGLFDLTGNVKEWCYGKTEYLSIFFSRGDSWLADEKRARIESPTADRSGTRYPNKGFRVVLDLSKKVEPGAEINQILNPTGQNWATRGGSTVYRFYSQGKGEKLLKGNLSSFEWKMTREGNIGLDGPKIRARLLLIHPDRKSADVILSETGEKMITVYLQ